MHLHEKICLDCGRRMNAVAGTVCRDCRRTREQLRAERKRPKVDAIGFRR